MSLKGYSMTKYVIGLMFWIFNITAIPVTSAQVLDEIIVTAQKREQNLQDVGISVTAFSGEAIKDLGFTSSSEIAAQTPGLNYTASGGEGGVLTFNLRGVGQGDFTEHQEAPVAIYVDDVYISAMPGAAFQLFDLERVEVLRGPQGTLFGRNATGGLLHFISAKPGNEYSGYTDLTFAEYNKVRFEGAAGGPISDSIRTRLSFMVDDQDGWMTNRIGKDGGAYKSWAGRGQLSVDISGDIEMQLKFYGSGQTGTEPLSSYAATKPTAADGTGEFVGRSDTFWSDVLGSPACAGCDAFGYVEPDNDPFTGAWNNDGALKNKARGATAKLTWGFDNLDLTAITDYQEIEKRYNEDSDGSPLDVLNASINTDVRQFSQELRIGGERDNSRWLAGIYYLTVETAFNGFLRFGEPSAFLLGVLSGGAPLPPFSIDQEEKLETESWAIFAHYEYDFAPQWTGIVGLRWSEDEKEQDLLATVPVLFGPFPLTDFDKQSAGNSAIKDLDENLSFHLELDWRPKQDWLVYAAISRGTKAGGFNVALDGGFPSGIPFADLVYDEEVLTSYSVGFKSTLFGGKARLNAEVFSYDYDDFQAFAINGVSSLLFNVDAEIKGVDLELLTTPREGWEFGFGLALLDTKAKDVPLPAATLDRELPFAPEVSFNGLGRYTWPMFTGAMAVQIDFNYVSDQFFDINQNAISVEDAHVIGNAHLTYLSGDNHYKLSLFVKNIADEEYRAHAFDLSGLGGLSQNWMGKPRWFGATLGYQW